MFYLNGAIAVWGQLMASEPRVLSLGFAGGGFSGLLLKLLSDWVHQSPILPDLAPLDCNCPNHLLLVDLSEREVSILIIGICIGLVLLPLLELLLVLRQGWSLWLRARILRGQKIALYRVV